MDLPRPEDEAKLAELLRRTGITVESLVSATIARLQAEDPDSVEIVPRQALRGSRGDRIAREAVRTRIKRLFPD